MKIYLWIDRLFDTFSKRTGILSILVLLYWAWQNIWQGVFVFDLFRVEDYASLFSFYEDLSTYTHSIFITTIIDMIENNSASILSAFGILFKNIGIIDGLILSLSLILFMKSKQKYKWYFFIIAYVFMILAIVICLQIGFHATSIDHLIRILHIFSISILIVEMMILCFLLYWIVWYTMGYIKEFSKDVHEI